MEVYRGDIKVADQAVKLKKGENRVVLKETIEQGGLTPITARLKGYGDTLLDNNSDFGLVSAAGKPRVLLRRERPRPGQAPDLGPGGAERAGRRPAAPRACRTTWPSSRTTTC